MPNYRLLICMALVALLGACSRGDSAGQAVVTTPGISDPNSFAQFFNPQVSLPAGDYTIVAATFSTGTVSDYILTITDDNGVVTTINGSWGAPGGSAGQNTTGNPTYPLTLSTGGGVTIDLVSPTSSDTYLYLLDASGNIVARDDDTGGNFNARIALPAPINSLAYAKAYYAMIDPSNNEDTLGKWQAANGFGGGYDEHVVFHDVRDLGYGRSMYVRGSTGAHGDVAVYVNNFAVDAGSGQYSNSSLNLDAAITNDMRWHIGTNAIEYTRIDPSDPLSRRIVKFFNFAPDGTRNLMVDLDGRGPKAMPGACIYCHGGRADPLKQQCDPTSLGGACNWAFPRQGNVWGRMQGIDVDAVQFSTQAGYTRADQEAALKNINRTVLCTYSYWRYAAVPTNPEDLCRTQNIPGEWAGDFSGAPLIKSWYGGPGMPSATFSDTYVPAEWMPGYTYIATVPSGSDTLYKNVIGPSCRTCHVLRDTENWVGLDFTYWEFTLDDTLGYKERIKHHVFDSGQMPLALLVDKEFWAAGNGPGTRPALLADALSALNSSATAALNSPERDASGNPLAPGRPIANPGPNNRVVTTPAKLTAVGSLFAKTYQWTILSGPSAATLSSATSMTPTFDTPTHTGVEDGVYHLQLVVGNGTTQSAPVDLTINVKNNPLNWVPNTLLPLPQNIRFADIRNILQSTVGVYGGTSPAGCSGCHNPGGGYDMAVFYSDPSRVGNSCTSTTADVPTGPCTDAQNMHQFYLDIRARVNFTDPEQSRILRKPSDHHHLGGLVNGFGPTTADGMLYYNIFLEWIMNGAPEY